MSRASRAVRQDLHIGRTLAVALGVTCIACSSQSRAATIVAPISAFATSEFISTSNNYSIGNTINQSGLSLGYTSGVTDFGSYLTSSPTHTSVANGTEWFSRDYGSHAISGLTVTYGFSALTAINGFALWNEEFAGIGSTQLLSSLDGITYNSLGTINPIRSTFAPSGTIVPYLAQTFSFSLTSMLFFRLLIADCPGPPHSQSSYHGCGIGEVAFSAMPPPGNLPPVPLPGALPLIGSTLGFFIWLGRRQRSALGGVLP